MNQYIDQLPDFIQVSVKMDVLVALRALDITEELDLIDKLEVAMSSKLHDLADLIDINKYSFQTKKCVTCSHTYHYSIHENIPDNHPDGWECTDCQFNSLWEDGY